MRIYLLCVVAVLPALLFGWTAIPLAYKVKARVEAGANWSVEMSKYVALPTTLLVLWSIVWVWGFVDLPAFFAWEQLPIPPLALQTALDIIIPVWLGVGLASLGMLAAMLLRMAIESIHRYGPE